MSDTDDEKRNNSKATDFVSGKQAASRGRSDGDTERSALGSLNEPVRDGSGGSARKDGGRSGVYRVKKPLVRRLVAAMVFVAVCIGIVGNVGTGTFSSFGWESIALLCPLGALEAMLATHSIIPRALVFLAVVALFSVVFGKIFCSWVCPVPGIRGFFDRFKRRKPEVRSAQVTHEEGRGEAGEPQGEAAASDSPCRACGACAATPLREKFDSRHIVLGGSLLSAAVFGFPVFCLICPIGLTCATVIAVAQLFGGQTLSWGLLVFPLILILEMTVLRKWCSRFCPMGALFSLASLPNRLFRPKVDDTKCLRAKGVDCRVCSNVCPEALDPHCSTGMNECSKCRDCAVSCPTGAISFPLLPPARKR